MLINIKEYYVFIKKMENEVSPKNLDEFIGNEVSVEELKQWASDVKKDIYHPKRICFITGSSGTGKTVLAKLLLENEGFTIRHFISSNLRIKQERDLLYQTLCFKDIIALTKKSSTFRKAIIIDDFENMCLATLEVFRKVKEYIKQKKSIGIPILFIGNKYLKGKRPLMGTSIYVRLYPRQNKDIHKILLHILKVKNIVLSTSEQLDICKNSGGDVRKIIKYFELFDKSTTFINQRIGPLYSLDRIIQYDNESTIKSILSELSCDSSLAYGIYMSYINYVPWIIKKNNTFNHKERCSRLWKNISELFSIYAGIKDYEKNNQMWELDDISHIISCWGMRCLIKEEIKNTYKKVKNKASYVGKNFWWVDLEKGKKTGDEPIEIPICNKLLRGHLNSNIISNTSFKMIESGHNSIAWKPKNIRGTMQILKLFSENVKKN